MRKSIGRKRALVAASLFAGLVTAARADAAQTQSGTYVQIFYGSNGSWSDHGVAKGLQISDGSSAFREVIYPGTAWSQMTIEFLEGATARSYETNTGAVVGGLVVAAEQSLASGSTNKAFYRWTAGIATIERTETWADGDKTIQVLYKVTNNSPTVTITNLRLMAAFDPDQDYHSSSTFDTKNDRRDLDGNGKDDWVESAGAVSNWTVGFGACDEARQTVGHTDWETDADAPFTDQNGTTADYTMHWRHTVPKIAPGGTAVFSFVFAFDTTPAAARTQFANARAAKCVVCDDKDGDGFADASCGGNDCDDTNAAIHPGATEICNLVDDNCSGTIDEGFTKTTWYRDADGDTYGAAATTTSACMQPPGFVAAAGDCNDGSSAIHPGAAEVCNGVDDNCDGTADEGVQTTFYRDGDGDGYGKPGDSTLACAPPAGYVANGADCNDANASIHPGAAEVCNGADDDCNGSSDEGVTSTFHRDQDGDGFGNAAVSVAACAAPAGYVSDATDCNDALASVHPGATETCNGIDDNCNSVIDEGVKSTFYKDGDGDGYGNAADSTLACSAPSTYVADSTDCDDSSATVHPGATEIADDGVDQNCSGADTVTCYVDGDGDGHGAAPSLDEGTCATGHVATGGDCNDGLASVHPGAAETCNGVDDDCNGTVDDGGDSLCAAGSICVATGGVTACREGCRSDAACSAPKSLCDATKLTCEVCTATDSTACATVATGTTCIEDPAGNFCGCTVDSDCGSSTSGRICDGTTKKCVDGCAVADSGATTPRNGCPTGLFCTTVTPGTTGVCTTSCNFDSDCTSTPDKPFCFTPGLVDAGTDGGSADTAAGEDAGEDAAEDAGEDAAEDTAIDDAGAGDAADGGAPGTPICVQCRDDLDCAGRADGKTLCSPTTHMCVECTETSKDKCSASGTGAACLPEGRCGCTTSTDCADGKTCDTTTSTCVEAPDAGPDGGPSDGGSDAGPADAGDASADASADANADSDVTPSADAGTEAGGSCGCEVPGGQSTTSTSALAGLAALAAFVLRRRRR